MYNPEQVPNSLSLRLFIHKVVMIIAQPHRIVMRIKWVTAYKALRTMPVHSKCSIYINGQDSIIHLAVNHKFIFWHLNIAVLNYFLYPVFSWLDYNLLEEINVTKVFKKKVWHALSNAVERLKRVKLRVYSCSECRWERDTTGFKFFWPLAKYFI